MKLTFEELRTWLMIVETGSITSASEQLNQTASTVSRALSRLEKKLGTTLLHRTTRRLALTEEGRLLSEHARTIITAVEEAEHQISRCGETPAGRLRINAATPFMLHVIVPLVVEFQARYPQISLELNTDDLIIDLLEHQTDIAIRIGELRDSTIHARLLGYSQLRLLASPAYLSLHGKPERASDLVHHRTLGFTRPEKHNLWPVCNEQGKYLQIKPDIAASSGETIRQLALAGQGIARLSDFTARPDIESGRLVQVLTAETQPMSHPVNAVYYQHSGVASRISCFIRFLSEKLDKEALL